MLKLAHPSTRERGRELELDEALDERTIDLLGVVPVEAVEGLERTEAGEPCPAREVDCDARAFLEFGEWLECLGRTEVALVNMGEEGGELRMVDAEPEPAPPARTQRAPSSGTDRALADG